MNEKIIIFDLGNVLLKFDFNIVIDRMCKLSPKRREEILEYILTNEDRFERGLISNEEYYEKTKTMLNINIDYDNFCKYFSEMFEPMNDMIELLKKLSKNYRTFLLSNCNKIHIDYIWDKYDLWNYFEKCFFSYEIGYRKPEKEAFWSVLNYANIKPENAIFTDDMEKNVLGAKEIGINSFVFVNKEDFVNQIIKVGINP
jgi:putative hydrolase of the HAD superfamily